MSKIEWTERTWNPVAGCTRVSAGCDNCYAVTMTRRLSRMAATKERYEGLVNPGKGHFNGKIRLIESALEIPLRRKKPTMWFVNSMSDLFHEGVPDEYIARVFAVMGACPQHTFQVLTKRPVRALYSMSNIVQLCEEYLHGRAVQLEQWPLPNVWLGVSAEDQATANERIPILLQTPAAIKFISVEPMLGAVDFDFIGHDDPLSNLQWVIVGGESGHGARPMHPDWVRSVRDQCVAAGVPFFFKQGSKANWSNYKAFESFPLDLQMREYPGVVNAERYNLPVEAVKLVRELKPYREGE